MALQRPGTSVLPPANRMFEKSALTPHKWLGLRFVAEKNIASPGVNIVNFISANIYYLALKHIDPLITLA
jgi:hypothetical protein